MLFIFRQARHRAGITRHLALAPAGELSGTASMEPLEARRLFSASVPGFLPASTIAVNGTPTAFVTDDFNQDGNDDLAIAQGSTNNVAVLLGNGDGTFGPAAEFAAGADPTAIVTGDFNNDGVDDIATADAGTGDVSILLGQSDSDGDALGTFAAAINIHVETPGAGPMSLAAGDFNDDGNLDLAVGGPSGLYVLLGNGDGTFSAPKLVAHGDFSAGVVADSFTQSGNTDLAALDPSAGNVVVFAGNGDGTFAAPAVYPVGVGASSIASGDLNNDGAEDIAVTLPGRNAVEVLLQNTTTITEPTSTVIPIDSVPLTPAGNSGSGGGYSYSVGAGTFASPITIHLDQSPNSLFLDDVTGDGNLDIVTANGASNTLSIIPGNGDGTFGSPVDISVGNNPVSVAADDVNSDGGDDLISANAGNGASDTGSVSVALQESSDVGVTLAASTPSAVLGSDLTYTATIANNGPGAATDVNFDDYLPSSYTFVSAVSSQGTVDSSDPADINVSLGDLPSGASASVTIVASANQYGDAGNTASVYSDSIDANYNNNSASIDTPVVGTSGAEVALTGNSNENFYPILTPVNAATAAGSTAATTTSDVASLPTIGVLPPIGFEGARVGDDYTYSFTVNNYGPQSAADLNVTDTLPAGVTYVSSAASQGTTDASTPGTVTVNLGDLASGGSATITIVIKPTIVGAITNSASVTSTTADPYSADNSTTSTTFVYSDHSTGPIPILYTSGTTTATTIAKLKSDAPLPTLSISNVRKTNATAGQSDFVFTVTRTGNLSSPSTVEYSTASGSAKAGKNFHPVKGTLTFAASASSQTVSVPVDGAKKYKPNQTFVVALSRPANATLKKSRAVGTIVSAAAPAAPNPFAKGIAINFAPASTPAVKGYLKDTGAVYALGSNGLTYGWSANNTASAVIEDNGKNPLLDTFNVLGAGGSPAWKIAMPNGRYRLKLTTGDPADTANKYQVDANGEQVLDGFATNKHRFVSSSAVITITGGLLTLTTGASVSFDDLDFLRLKYIGG